MLELIDGREQHTPVHLVRPKPAATGQDPRQSVASIVEDVRIRGDSALIEYTEKFDGVRVTADRLRVPEEKILKARELVRPELVHALEVMAERLRRTGERQMQEDWVERGPDEMVGEVIRPLRRVGVYVPGGRAAYPSSVMMAAIPAQVAGVEGISVCSPPRADGEIAEAVLAACAVANVSEVYCVGGAQAIAALAYGTESVRPVEKIVGPGNIYVTLAKRRVQGWVGVDSEAGPTELVIVADESADPSVLASDLIAQAEHGPLGSHILVTWVPELAERVMRALEIGVARHERADDVENALIEGGRAILVRDLDQALETVNAFAPEHLQLVFEGAMESVDRVRNAGSVFVGPYSPVAIGDYIGGTNHVLPSGGSARWSSGLGVGDFLKRIYVSSFERSALERFAPHIDSLAEAEGLNEHSRSVEIRLQDKKEPLI
ncbi:MAG TPA: histidinol dehydrogenase [Actinomycetota bacterium]|nr:histidinol dehydrogenase [Actinomycetota bacterium]